MSDFIDDLIELSSNTSPSEVANRILNEKFTLAHSTSSDISYIPISPSKWESVRDKVLDGIKKISGTRGGDQLHRALAQYNIRKVDHLYGS